MAATTVLRPGALAGTPFSVLIVANPSLLSLATGQYSRDPILDDRAAFTACATYVDAALFGSLPGQLEPVLGDPRLAAYVRVLSLFDAAMPNDDEHAFVAEDDRSDVVVPRRVQIAAYVAAEGLVADVVYAVSASATHRRASALYTSDDVARGGTPFDLDGTPHVHATYYRIPGTIALPVSSYSLTAVHEFQHAVSSYENGQIVDLYVDSPNAVNCRRPKPIDPAFRRYGNVQHQSDPARSPFGYPAAWGSYHCLGHAPQSPAIMDDYWFGAPPEACQNDTITRAFITDRVLAKIGRP